MSTISYVALYAAAIVAPLCANAYDLHTKELTPIKEEKAPVGAPVKLIEDGQLKFVIAADLQAEKRTKNCHAEKSIAPAIEILKEAFALASGTTPEVIDIDELENETSRSCVIAVGDNSLARKYAIDAQKLPDDGFVVSTCPNGIVIAGNDSSLREGFNSELLDRRGSSRGTMYGANDFAERFLGVRYYFPGEYGTYAPKLRSLTVNNVKYRDSPWFRTHGSRYYYIRDFLNAKELQRWRRVLGEKVTVKDVQKLLDKWRSGSTGYGGGHHSPEPHAYLKSHPDKAKTIFYTSPHGKFWHNPAAHIGNYYNVFDLGFADMLADDYIQYIQSGGKIKNPGFGNTIGGKNSISFGVCDTYMPIGEVLDDPIVKKFNLVTKADIERGKDAGMANIYGRFYQHLGNRLKSAIPDAKLWLLIYYNSTYASLDPRWRLPDNIEINFCARHLPLYTRNAAKMEETRKMLQEWYDALGGRPAQKIWLYNSRMNTFARAVAPEFIGEIPKLFGKLIGREGGLFYDWDGSKDIWNFYYAGYGGTKSQWNPDFDVDAAIDAHWEKFYGAKAGLHLKKFHRLLKDAYLKYFVNANIASPQYPPSVISEMEACLKAAEAELQDGSLESKRFRLFAEPWPEAFAKQRALAAYRTPVYNVARKGEGNKPIELFDPAGSGAKTDNRSDIRLWWDEKGIYGTLRANYIPKADGKANFWANDTLELFFSPGLKKEAKYMVAFDAAGRKYTEMQRLLPIPQPVDMTWKCPGAKIKTNISGDGWAASFFVPFSDFEEGAPKVYDTWNFNIVRTKRSGAREIVGNSLTMGNHHNLTMYGTIKFAGKGDACKTNTENQTRVELGNGTGRYPFMLSSNPPRGGNSGSFTFKPAEFRDKSRSGISSLINWFALDVNGIKMEKLVFDPSTVEISGERKTAKFVLNYDGAKASVKLFLADNSPVLHGEISMLDASRVQKAKLTLSTIPSMLAKKGPNQARFTGYRRTVKEESGHYIFGDEDFDGSAADGSKGFGPTVFFVDKSTAANVRAEVNGSWTSRLEIDFDASKTLKFALYENFGAPKSDEEVRKLLFPAH